MRTRPGNPYPLGATRDGSAVTFAIFSEGAAGIELCLIDAAGCGLGQQVVKFKTMVKQLHDVGIEVIRHSRRHRMPDTVRILVVDDDAEMRALLVDELRHEGYQLTEAADGAEAVLACRTSEFDVILMDKNMPGPSGLDLLPGFRRTCPHAHIIMMTAFGDVPSYVEAAEKGAADFLFKPFRIEEMKAAIRKALTPDAPSPA